jgi:uncharacterized SAM-binding protein YcdF (DUF218 family)
MFYVLSKTAGLVADAAVLIGLIALTAAVAGLLRRPRLAAALSLSVCAAVVAGGFTTLGDVLLKALEDRFPLTGEPARVDGIVVLGGGLNAIHPERGYELNDAGDRFTEAVRLGRRHPDAWLVISGGVGALEGAPGTGDAEVAPALFSALGFTHARLLLEPASRNTAENAAKTAALIKDVFKPGQTWLLVTSAFHMPRAVGVFRAQGLDVVPWPVDFRARSPVMAFTLVGPAEQLNTLSMALREWFGLLVYWAAGHTKTFLPGADD